MTPAKHKVVLIGESPMVEEFSSVWLKAGYEIFCRVGGGGKAGTQARNVRKISSIPRSARLAVELTNIDLSAKRKNLSLLERSLPPSTLILSSSVTVSATEQSSWLKHPRRFIGISALPTLLDQKLVELAPTVYSDKRYIPELKDIVSALGKEMTLIQDRIGMVLPRILCMLINEASFSIMEGTASAESIDIAMKLGTNYPLGPIEWAEKIGLNHVTAVLDALHLDLGEERYRVSPLLRQLAAGKKWW